MNFKKLTALVLAVLIISSVFVMPALATETEEDVTLQLEAEKFKKYIVNDQFNTAGDTSGWAKGRVKSNTSAFSVSQGTAPDGSGALVFVNQGDKSVADGGNEPNVFKEFSEKIAISSQNPIVIKTRFMQAGNGASTPAGTAYLRFNQPNNENLLSNNNIPYSYPNMTTKINNANSVCDWFTLLKMDASAIYYRQYNSTWGPTAMANVNTVGKWIEATITITGDTSVKIEAKIDSATYKKGDASLSYKGNGPLISYTLYNDPTATTALTAYPSLDSLTWVAHTKNTVYVDYVEVYQEIDYTNASVAVTSGTTNIRAKDPVTIQFTSDSAIGSLPEAAFEIVGVETEFSYNAETKTVSLTPVTSMEPGGSYNLNINEALIKETVGVVLTGENDFVLEVCNISVSNLAPVGKVIPGTIITASYLYSSPVAEGTHSYQWQVSDTGEENTFTDINGAISKDFEVGTEHKGKYIRFEMIPYDINGLSGYSTTSSVLIPEKAPVVSNPAISTDTLFEGIYITASYDFYDENGDNEGETVYKWFTGDTADGPWTEKHTGKTYLIGSEDNGKYIKCVITPVSISEIEKEGVGDEVIAGPVVNILRSTNMFADAGFESGVIESPWMYSNNWDGADIQSKDTHTGEYALHLSPRVALNDHFGQKLSFKKGKTYVFGAWAKKSRAKAQDIKGMTVFAGGDTLQTSVGTASYTLNDRWQLMSFAYQFKADCTPNSGFVTWSDIDTADVYMDDWYCGELLIGDIETYDVEPVTIPLSGETSVSVTSGKVLNQLGSNDGLQNENVVVSIPETDGVYVQDNKIVVTEQAHASTIVAEIYCEPEYSGATQTKFQKFVEIELASHNDPTPKALNVKAEGVVATDSVLTGTYDFYQIDDKADASTYKWMYSDSENGTYTPIEGATATSYTVESQYAGKYIKFVVLPETEDGLTGKEVYSNALVAPRAPVATEVKITGDMAVGEVITGEYVYFDANYDAEGTSLYRWLISDTADGAYVPVEGETLKTLTLTEEMKNKYIKFEVTPVAVVAPITGVAKLSEAALGPVPPKALNVSISQDGYRLKGLYTYSHPNYIPEKGSLYKWTVDGVAVSDNADYLINFTGAKLVTFSVTPGCELEPSKGETVTISLYIQGYADSMSGTGGGGGGFGGGGGGVGGGSGSGVGVTNVNDMKLPEIEVPKEEKPKTDISGHWGETYINNMASRGVMTADENGNYKPDEFVSREIMLTYLFKALGLEMTEYKNEFGDVADGDFAKMLQTMVDNGTIAKDENFRPDDTISREEMCKILYVSLKNANKLKETEEMKIESFADYSNISEWARTYVNGIYSNGIMVGVSDTEFDAKGTVTRAQAATMLTRILALTEGE